MSAKIHVMTSYLCNNGDVINVLLPLCRICVEYIQLDNKVMIEGGGDCS